nr:hypothetical protein [Endozoicomonas sp.]
MKANQSHYHLIDAKKPKRIQIMYDLSTSLNTDSRGLSGRPDQPQQPQVKSTSQGRNVYAVNNQEVIFTVHPGVKAERSETSSEQGTYASASTGRWRLISDMVINKVASPLAATAKRYLSNVSRNIAGIANQVIQCPETLCCKLVIIGGCLMAYGTKLANSEDACLPIALTDMTYQYLSRQYQGDKISILRATSANIGETANHIFCDNYRNIDTVITINERDYKISVYVPKVDLDNASTFSFDASDDVPEEIIKAITKQYGRMIHDWANNNNPYSPYFSDGIKLFDCPGGDDCDRDDIPLQMAFTATRKRQKNTIPVITTSPVCTSSETAKIKIDGQLRGRIWFPKLFYSHETPYTKPRYRAALKNAENGIKNNLISDNRNSINDKCTPYLSEKATTPAQSEGATTIPMLSSSDPDITTMNNTQPAMTLMNVTGSDMSVDEFSVEFGTDQPVLSSESEASTQQDISAQVARTTMSGIEPDIATMNSASMNSASMNSASMNSASMNSASTN